MTHEQIRWLESLFQLHLVQLSIVIAACLLVVHLLARRHPHLCYALLLVALAKCLFPPVIMGPLGLPFTAAATLDPQSRDVNLASTGKQSAVSRQQGVKATPPRSNHVAGARFDSLPPVRRIEQVAPGIGGGIPRKKSSQQSVSPPRFPSAWLLIPLGTGLVLLSAWCARGCYLKRKLWQGLNRELTTELQSTFDELSDALHLKGVRFWVTETEVGPAAFGVWRPTVVIPARLARSCRSAELRVLLSHELNHIRRRDSLVAVAQTLTVCLWWFNPLVWLLSKQLSRFREYCCDLETIAYQNIGPKEYCVCLLNSINPKCRDYPQLGLGASPFIKTKQRLEMIMTNNKRRLRGTPKPIWYAAVTMALLLLPGAAGTAINADEHEEVGTIFYVSQNGIAAIDGDEPRLVFPTFQNMEYPTVSPDGKSIAHVSWVDKERRVWVASGQTRPRPISPDHGQEFIQQIAWSPSGRLIAYRTQGTSKSAVYLVAPDGSQHHRLKTFDGKFGRGIEYYNDFCWSPAGKSLAIAKVVEININQFADMIRVTRSSVLEIYDVATDRRQTKTRIVDRHPIAKLAWSPDGKWLAYKSNKKLMLVSAEAKAAPRVLHESIDPTGFPRWRPDSQALLVHINRGNAPRPPGAQAPANNVHEFLIVGLDKSVVRVPAEREIWYYDWLPNGKQFVATSSDRALLKYTVDGSNKTIASDAGFWSRVQVVNTALQPAREKQ